MIGTGKARIARTVGLTFSRSDFVTSKFAMSVVLVAAKSAPAQKDSPAPVRITTRVPSSDDCLIAARSNCTVSRSTELRLSGRLMVMCLMRSSSETSSFSGWSVIVVPLRITQSEPECVKTQEVLLNLRSATQYRTGSSSDRILDSIWQTDLGLPILRNER